MALISELITEIKVKTEDFNRGIDAAKAKALDFSRSSKTIQTAFVASFAIVASSAALIYNALSKAIDQVDDLGKSAQKAGIQFESFQSLKFAADLSDVSINNLQSSLGKMSTFIGQADKGMKSNVQTLKDLGLSAKDLKNQSIDEQFVKISEALQKINNPTDQRSAVRSIFGRGGLELMPLLKSNIEETRQEWESYGVTLSDVQFQQSEIFNDTKKKIAEVRDAFIQNIGANTAPAFNVLAQNILDSIKTMGGLKEVSKDVSEFIINRINNIVQVFNLLRDSISQVIEAMNNLNPATLGERAANLVGGAEESILKNGLQTILQNKLQGNDQGVLTSGSFYKGIAQDFTATASDTARTASGLLKGISPFSSTTQKLDGVIANLGNAMAIASNATKKTSNDLDALSKSTQKVSGAMKQLDQLFGINNTEQEGLSYLNKNLPANNKSQAIDPDFNKLLADIRDEFSLSGGKVTNRIQMDLALAKQIAKTSGGTEVGIDPVTKDYTFKETSNSGMLNSIKLLENYINGKMQKQQEVKITVEPTDFFIVKVAKDSYTQQTVKQFVTDTIANAALGAAK